PLMLGWKKSLVETSDATKLVANTAPLSYWQLAVAAQIFCSVASYPSSAASVAARRALAAVPSEVGSVMIPGHSLVNSHENVAVRLLWKSSQRWNRFGIEATEMRAFGSPLFKVLIDSWNADVNEAWLVGGLAQASFAPIRIVTNSALSDTA